jgi:hypothetical protein
MPQSTSAENTKVENILQAVSLLNPEDQLFVTAILNKRMIEVRRNQILARAKEAEENYQQGNTRTVSVNELMMSAIDD